jgi:hypothetical protein
MKPASLTKAIPMLLVLPVTIVAEFSARLSAISYFDGPDNMCGSRPGMVEIVADVSYPETKCKSLASTTSPKAGQGFSKVSTGSSMEAILPSFNPGAKIVVVAKYEGASSSVCSKKMDYAFYYELNRCVQFVDNNGPDSGAYVQVTKNQAQQYSMQYYNDANCSVATEQYELDNNYNQTKGECFPSRYNKETGVRNHFYRILDEVTTDAAGKLALNPISVSDILTTLTFVTSRRYADPTCSKGKQDPLLIEHTFMSSCPETKEPNGQCAVEADGTMSYEISCSTPVQSYPSQRAFVDASVNVALPPHRKYIRLRQYLGPGLCIDDQLRQGKAIATESAPFRTTFFDFESANSTLESAPCVHGMKVVKQKVNEVRKCRKRYSGEIRTHSDLWDVTIYIFDSEQCESGGAVFERKGRLDASPYATAATCIIPDSQDYNYKLDIVVG